MRSISTKEYGSDLPSYVYSPSKLTSTYQKGSGSTLAFNSPKNDSSRGINLSAKLSLEAAKYSSKGEPILNRKNSKGNSETPQKGGLSASATFVKPQNSYNAPTYKTADLRNNSIDRRDNSNLGLSSSPSKQPYMYQSTNFSKVQESLRTELGYPPKSSKKLVIETSLDNSKGASDGRSYSAKVDNEETLSSKIYKKNNNLNKNNFDSYKLASSYTPPGRQAHQMIAFNNQKIQTEVDEEREYQATGPATAKNRSPVALDSKNSGSFYGNFGGSSKGLNRGNERERYEEMERQKMATINASRKIGFSSNGQLKYTNLGQGVIKSNNFFSSSGSTTWSSALNSSNKGASPTGTSNYSPQKLSPKQQDLTRSAQFEKKPPSRGQQDLRASMNIEIDTNDNMGTPKKQSRGSISKGSATPSNRAVEEKSSVQRPSLDNFITKVNRGDILGKFSKSPATPTHTSSNDIKPQRPSSKQHTQSIDDSTQAKPPTREGSRSVKNSDTKSLAVTTKSQQAVQEQQVRPASKSGRSPGLTSAKSPQREDNGSPSNREKKPFIYFVTSLEKHHREYDPSNYFCQIYREHFMQTYQALMFCRFLKPIDQKALNARKVNLPRKEVYKDKKTLIFDLDETLIHCNESTAMPSDVILPIRFPHGEIIEAGINIRPYAVDILKELSQFYEVVVFTASQSCYANVVIDHLDPKGQYVQHRLFREHCTPTEEGVYVKDLRVIANRNIQDMILVDNAAYSFGYQIENGIPIIPFYENKQDQELKHLIPYLKFLSTAKDPREINKLTFKLTSYTQYNTPDQILKNLVFQD